MKHLLFVLSILLCSAVYGGTTDPNVSDQKYLEYGKKHECVLPLMGILDDKMNSNFRGSCVLIDRYYILTAAHIVADSLNQYVVYDHKSYPCSIVAIPIEYNGKKMGSHDIAIARLQRPIDLDFYPQLYTEKDEVDKICSIAGYGFYGTFKTGYLQSLYDNQKRAGSNIIDSIEDDVLVFSVNREPKTSLEFLICPGDSGGGLFINQKLAGINSFIYAKDGKANADYGDSGCSTRISVYRKWIEDTKNTIEKIIKEADNER